MLHTKFLTISAMVLLLPSVIIAAPIPAEASDCGDKTDDDGTVRKVTIPECHPRGGDSGDGGEREPLGGTEWSCGILCHLRGWLEFHDIPVTVS